MKFIKCEGGRYINAANIDNIYIGVVDNPDIIKYIDDNCIHIANIDNFYIGAVGNPEKHLIIAEMTKVSSATKEDGEQAQAKEYRYDYYVIKTFDSRDEAQRYLDLALIPTLQMKFIKCEGGRYINAANIDNIRIGSVGNQEHRIIAEMTKVSTVEMTKVSSATKEDGEQEPGYYWYDEFVIKTFKSRYEVQRYLDDLIIRMFD